MPMYRYETGRGGVPPDPLHLARSVFVPVDVGSDGLVHRVTFPVRGGMGTGLVTTKPGAPGAPGFVTNVVQGSP